MAITYNGLAYVTRLIVLIVTIPVWSLQSTRESRLVIVPPALYLTVAERVVFFRILRFTVGDGNLNIFRSQDG
jgi:hypothetical protein